MSARKKIVAEEVSKGEVFTRNQLIASEKFNSRKDLLKAILSDKEKYSVSEVEKKIEGFMKGRVK